MAHSCSQTHCPGLLSAGHPKEKDTKADQRDLEMNYPQRPEDRQSNHGNGAK